MKKLWQSVMPIIGASVLVLGINTLPTQAASFTLDFNEDTAGNALDAYALDGSGQNGFSTTKGNVGEIWSSIGIDISVTRSNKPLGLFNSECLPKGGNSTNGFTALCNTSGSLGDPDLATGEGSYGNISYDTTPQGNLLILEENAGNDIPDDKGGNGGAFTFNFNEDIVLSAALQEIVFVDDAKGDLTLNYANNSSETLNFKATEENQLLNFSSGIDPQPLNSFTIDFNGSGGVSGVVFSEYTTKAVPEGEATLGLLVAGGLFGIRQIYKNKS